MLELSDNKKICNLAENLYMTYQEIGDEFNISRERVRQILVQHSPELVKKRRKRNTNECKYCDKVGVGVYERSSYGMCCEECMMNIRKKRKNRWSKHYDNCIECGTIEISHNAHGMCKKCTWKWRYKTSAKRRKQIKEATKKWAKNNPGKIKVIQDKAVRKYHEKLKADPIRYAKYLQKQRDRYHKNMKDPEYKKKMNKYYRERYKRVAV